MLLVDNQNQPFPSAFSNTEHGMCAKSRYCPSEKVAAIAECADETRNARAQVGSLHSPTVVGRCDSKGEQYIEGGAFSYRKGWVAVVP